MVEISGQKPAESIRWIITLTFNDLNHKKLIIVKPVLIAAGLNLKEF
jgi:hypothetical protein